MRYIGKNQTVNYEYHVSFDEFDPADVMEAINHCLMKSGTRVRIMQSTDGDSLVSYAPNTPQDGCYVKDVHDPADLFLVIQDLVKVYDPKWNGTFDMEPAHEPDTAGAILKLSISYVEEQVPNEE